MAIGFGFFFSCSGVDTQVELEKSRIQYSKPQASTKLIKGVKVDYELWVVKINWVI